MASQDNAYREQGAWAVGNIAGANTKCRDIVLDCGAVGALIDLIKVSDASNIVVTALRNAVWAVSNLCRGEPQPTLDAVTPALPVLVRMLHHAHAEAASNAAWAMSFFTDGGHHDRVHAAHAANVLPHMLELWTSRHHCPRRRCLLLSAPSQTLQTVESTFIDKRSSMVVGSHCCAVSFKATLPNVSFGTKLVERWRTSARRRNCCKLCWTPMYFR